MHLVSYGSGFPLQEAYAYDDTSHVFRNPNPFAEQRFSGLAIELKQFCHAYNIPLTGKNLQSFDSLCGAALGGEENRRTEHLLYQLYNQHGAAALEFKLKSASTVEEVIGWYSLLQTLITFATDQWYQNPLDEENVICVLNHQSLIKYVAKTHDSLMHMYLPWIKHSVQHDTATLHKIHIDHVNKYGGGTNTRQHGYTLVPPHRSAQMYQPYWKPVQQLFLKFIEIADLFLWNGTIDQTNRPFLIDTLYYQMSITKNRPYFFQTYFEYPQVIQEKRTVYPYQPALDVAGYIKLSNLQDKSLYYHLVTPNHNKVFYWNIGSLTGLLGVQLRNTIENAYDRWMTEQPTDDILEEPNIEELSELERGRRVLPYAERMLYIEQQRAMSDRVLRRRKMILDSSSSSNELDHIMATINLSSSPDSSSDNYNSEDNRRNNKQPPTRRRTSYITINDSENESENEDDRGVHRNTQWLHTEKKKIC